MEYIEEVLKQMLVAGVTIPALIVGYHLAYRKFVAVLLPLLIYAVADHLLIKVLEVIARQSNTLLKLGSKISPVDWFGDALQNIIAFFIVGFVMFTLCKLIGIVAVKIKK